MTASPPVDLRSDTVTRPTPAMRQAIAGAIVGDDVYGDDPTVLALEQRVAALTGKQAAVYVPSGTMGNQLAVNALTQPGETVMLEAHSHVFLYEQGGIAANSGCLAHTIEGTRGAISAAQVETAWHDATDEHISRRSLLCLENTFNYAGGVVVPLAVVKATAAAARERGMRVHLDGARLWNASVASGVPLAEWAACADTVMMCFSKGLGCPIGSILVGDAQVIQKARRTRKRWGGGMRQVGILAAACLYALDHHVDRLAEDHARAKRLAAGFTLPGVTVMTPETNIVFVSLDHPSLDATRVLAALAESGVWMSDYGHGRLRAVVHLDVGDTGIERAIDAFCRAVAARVGAVSR